MVPPDLLTLIKKWSTVVAAIKEKLRLRLISKEVTICLEKKHVLLLKLTIVTARAISRLSKVFLDST